MQTRNNDFIYKKELDKACFQVDMAYGKSKDLAKRTQSNKVLRGLAPKVYKFFNKKSTGSGIVNETNYQLADEIHKTIIKKLKKKKLIQLLETIFGTLI